MQTVKSLSLILALLFILLSLPACNDSSNDSSEQTSGEINIYRFEDYESSDIFDIKKVELNTSLAEKCTSYKFTYLSDGLKIKGFISIPVSLEESQKPGKCLLYNRGGNRDYGKLNDDETANICAVCNRIVIASQYRGADGSEGADQFGGNDLHDVIKLIDFCANDFGFVDMDDFCVAGVSRGGVMTYPAARQDKRIKRIIAVSAISDLIESYNARDDMKTVLKETIGCTPKDNPEEYKKRSAVYWADEIKIPVLIIHSKQDKKVSFKQSEKLYKKLKDNTDCTFITHDDDYHGLQQQDFATVCKWLNN